ncbi:MAG: hypothetical protein KGL10_00020, partial [Alphaproteobacteria bacterium]|nr:hypothetical protein [Alphaproteobacteria bacterium]
IALPAALTAVAGCVGFLFTRKATELKVIPLGVVVVGASCAKAMFVTPFQAAFRGIRSAFNAGAKRPSAPPSAPVNAPKNAPKPPQA